MHIQHFQVQLDLKTRERERERLDETVKASRRSEERKNCHSSAPKVKMTRRAGESSQTPHLYRFLQGTKFPTQGQKKKERNISNIAGLHDNG